MNRFEQNNMPIQLVKANLGFETTTTANNRVLKRKKHVRRDIMIFKQELLKISEKFKQQRAIRKYYSQTHEMK